LLTGSSTALGLGLLAVAARAGRAGAAAGTGRQQADE
jgi:hypothetical protein